MVFAAWLLAAIVAGAVMIAWVRSRRWHNDHGDEGGGGGGWGWGRGGGGGGSGGGPTPGGGSPAWWPEFERQFAEHVEMLQAREQVIAGEIAGPRSDAVLP
jgi:hypothetical protein